MKLTSLNCNFLGINSDFFQEIDSTQDEILRRIKNRKIRNGELVIADIQKKGKGTHGRIWHTDESANIAFSFYVEMNSNIKCLDGITYEIAEVITELFREKYNIKLQIKLPNDIIYKNKKIGGILTEAKINKEIVKYLVIGIGINTNKMNFSDDIKEIATSIRREFDIEINSIDFISEFCNKFERKILSRINNYRTI